MTSLALQRDALMPRQPGGTGPGFALALVVHGLLVAALAVGVHWRASEPEGVEAELWAAVPQIAAPKAVEPEPAPVVRPEPPKPLPVPKPEPAPDAQIAIEKAKREELDRKKKEQAEQLAERQRQEQEDKRKKQLEDQKVAALREQNLKRMLGQAGATGEPTSTGQASKDAGPPADYLGRVRARIKPNVSFPDTLAGNPEVEIEVRLAPDGTIVSSRVTKASGAKEWDDAVLRAIEKTAVLPRNTDGRVWSPLTIVYRPRD